MITIKLNGKEYPYIETMGALVAFKAEEGIEISDVKLTDSTHQVKYMYLVLRGACRHLGQEEFPLTFDEFCTALTGDEFLRVRLALAKEVKKRLAENEKNG